MILDACEWHSGADRYTGTVASAIAAYGFPIATQVALIAAFERREFIDTVVIDRDSIRGKHHAYEPELRGMHFGSRGRVCGNVSRAGWSETHAEVALVVCALDECVGWPSVCGNVFRLRRLVADRPPQFEVVPLGFEPAGLTPIGGPAPAPLLDLPTEPTGAGPYPTPAWFYVWPTSTTYAYSAPGFPAGVPVAAIPEPSTYALLGGGLAALCIWRERAAKRGMNR